MTSDPDLRAAVEALANEWEHTYCAKPRTLGFNDAFLRDLRAILAILAEHPATSGEGDDWHEAVARDMDARWDNDGGAEPDAATLSRAERHGCAVENEDNGRLQTCRDCAAEPDAGGEGLTDEIERACEVMHDAYEAAAVVEGWETQERSRKPWRDVPEANKATMRAALSALLASDLLADRERRTEARGAERALREAADEIETTDGGISRGSVIRLGALADAARHLRDRADRIAGEGR